MAGVSAGEMRGVSLAGRRLEYAWTRPRAADGPVLVFLHEGLGSARLWRDFPARLGARTGLPGLAYSRWGHGGSGVLRAPRAVDYMHREALEVLPALRAALGLDDVILVGHSDGASIALIHAGAGRWPVRALVLEAAHVFVEERTVAGVEAAKSAYARTDLSRRLARHHADAERTFRSWSDIWLDPAFRGWNIESFLPAVTCPVLAIQGGADEYGTARQVEAIARGCAGRVETLLLPGVGHAPHRDAPGPVLDAAAAFAQRCSPSASR